MPIDLFRKTKSRYSSTANSFGTGTGVTITPNSVSGLPTDTDISLTFDRVDTNGTAVPGNKIETIIGTIVGANFVVKERGADGTTEQAHTSPVVETIQGGRDYSDFVDGILAEHTQTGAHDPAVVASMTASSIAGASWFIDEDAMTTNSAVKVPSQQSVKAYVDAHSSSFWTTVPGTPTRVSDTQFTITDTSNANKYDLLLKKGVVLKWDESGTFQTGIVASSSYGANVVTVNLVGDSLTAGFTLMKYAANQSLVETFIVPGVLPSAAATDLSKSWHVPCDAYIIAGLPYHKIAGTTNATTYDFNDDGSTKFTTKLSVASAATKGTLQVADTPSTAVAEDSVMTLDVDSISTTAPTDAYVYIFWYPVSWRYRT